MIKDFLFPGTSLGGHQATTDSKLSTPANKQKKTSLLQSHHRAHTNEQYTPREEKNRRKKKRTQDELEHFIRILRDGQGENHPTLARRMHARKRNTAAHNVLHLFL